MRKLSIATKDTSLRRDLLAFLSKGYKISDMSEEHLLRLKEQLILFDMDTVESGLLQEYCKSNFVIAVTKQKKTDPVIEATTCGAYEVLHRPFKERVLFQTLEELQELRRELADKIDITKATLAPAATCAIVGYSAPILDVCKTLAQAAKTEAPVLITGETGTGKELIAEAIVQLSSRFGKPFEVINCAAIPENLLESELFGYEKGAFTGALTAKEGRLRIADGGCVFFDEIGELPLSLQGKLLRFLQSQTFHPVGSIREVQVNVRVIAATNRNLMLMIREQTFREDLYYRLAVVKIHVPPLRERKEDITSLVQFLFYRHKLISQKPIKGVTKAFLDKLLSHQWLGNIRELDNVIRRAIATSKTQYLTTHELKNFGPPSAEKGDEETAFYGRLRSVLDPFLKEILEKNKTNIHEIVHRDVDKILLDLVLSASNQNQSEAARILGINRMTLRKRLKEL